MGALSHDIDLPLTGLALVVLFCATATYRMFISWRQIAGQTVFSFEQSAQQPPSDSPARHPQLPPPGLLPELLLATALLAMAESIFIHASWPLPAWLLAVVSITLAHHLYHRGDRATLSYLLLTTGYAAMLMPATGIVWQSLLSLI